MTFILALLSYSLFAQDVALTVQEYDGTRNRAVITSLDATPVPMGTTLRVHSKTGHCDVKITEQVNNQLIGETTGCEAGIISPGMKLAYSPTNSWEQRPVNTEPAQISTGYDAQGILAEVMERTSFFMGLNFANQMEGKVYADSRVKDLDGDSALSFGVKGRVYDFTDRIYLATELSYETPRTFDSATFATPTGDVTQGTQGYSPRMSLWGLAAQGEFKVTDRLIGFAGLNLSIPSLRNSPFKLRSDLGFQGGATYRLYPNIAMEALIKVTNMNLQNNIGETTDVSLAGLELRGRYNF